MGEADVRAAFAIQARYCEELGSPFTARLCRIVGERLDGTTLLGRTVLGWSSLADARNDALPLRLAGGLHGLVRQGAAPDLAAAYPPNAAPAADAVFWSLLSATFGRHGPHLVEALRSAPQTNEVRRSALLMAGLAVIAGETGLPVALNELGASAGLNLIPERYDIRLGGRAYGATGSPVRLEPEWIGPPPPSALPRVVGAEGVDLNPLRVIEEADRERLLSYIWADQTDRLDRTTAAMALAAASPPSVAAGDAADWVEERLSTPHPAGAVRVVTHTIAVQYFPESVKTRIAAALNQAGRTATAAAPLARLGFELSPDAGQAELSLTLWPGGRSCKLARADAHGVRVTWLAGAA